MSVATMNATRTTRWAARLAGTLLLVSVGGCSGAEEGVGDERAAPTPSATSVPNEPPPAGTTPRNEAGSPPDAAIDAGDAGTPKPKDAFDGAPAYVAQTGPSTRQSGHNFGSNTPKTNPAGRACLNCHGDSGGAPTFAAAGTVYEGTKPAVGAEVRAIDAEGTAYSAYTDADGNFFFRATATALLELPAMVGARSAKGTRLMSTAAPKGNCNECHSTAGGAGRIVVGP